MTAEIHPCDIHRTLNSQHVPWHRALDIADDCPLCEVIDDRTPIEASLRGECGWLTMTPIRGGYRYGLTMDRASAPVFAPGAVRDLHILGAVEAGLTI